MVSPRRLAQLAARLDLVGHFQGSNDIDTIHRPRPDERAPKSGLPDFGISMVSKSATADFDSRVSKDGHKRGRANGHPSRRAPIGALLWMRSVGCEFRPSDPVGFTETAYPALSL
jgi:hypothetical protein